MQNKKAKINPHAFPPGIDPAGRNEDCVHLSPRQDRGALREGAGVRNSEVLTRRLDNLIFGLGYERQGFGLIETVVGAAIISVVLFGLAQVGQFAFRLTDEANFKIRASYLAEEGLEAARAMRDSGWSENIAPKALDTDYFFNFTEGQWRLGLIPVSPVDNVFGRRIRFSAVYRNAEDDIVASGGALDPSAKKVTVDVWWSNRGRTSTTTVSTYLTNLFND